MEKNLKIGLVVAGLGVVAYAIYAMDKNKNSTKKNASGVEITGANYQEQPCKCHTYTKSHESSNSYTGESEIVKYYICGDSKHFSDTSKGKCKDNSFYGRFLMSIGFPKKYY
jgi:hypothetical protein